MSKTNQLPISVAAPWLRNLPQTHIFTITQRTFLSNASKNMMLMFATIKLMKSGGRIMPKNRNKLDSTTQNTHTKCLYTIDPMRSKETCSPHTIT